MNIYISKEALISMGLTTLLCIVITLIVHLSYFTVHYRPPDPTPIILDLNTNTLSEEVQEKLMKELMRVQNIPIQGIQTTVARQADKVDQDIKEAQTLLEQYGRKKGTSSSLDKAGTATSQTSPPTKKSKPSTGKTSIQYKLGHRKAISIPPPSFLTKRSGQIVITIYVNREGITVATKAQKKTNIPQAIIKYAEEYALKATFEPDYSAPTRQKGWIRYTFIAQ